MHVLDFSFLQIKIERHVASYLRHLILPPTIIIYIKKMFALKEIGTFTRDEEV